MNNKIRKNYKRKKTRESMKSKFVFILLLVVVILGLVLGFAFNMRNNAFLPRAEVLPTIPSERRIETEGVPTETLQIEPTSTPYLTPTFPPLSEAVKSIDSDKITISGKSGDMIIPKDPSIVKVLKKSGESLIPANFEEVKIGQIVTLKIIRPGKEAELILE